MRAHRERTSGKQKLHLRILAVHNGKVTEAEILDKIKYDANNGVVTVKYQSGAIDALIEKASELYEKDAKQGDAYDKVFIIADVDNYSLAKINGYRQRISSHEEMILCLSNPCIEVWALCYVGMVPGGACTISGAQALAKKSGVVINKKIALDKITDHRKAVEEARRLRRQYGENVANSAPTTDMDRLLEYIASEMKNKD